jgi:dTDP-4-amino-4,6-dideoxygalactose transaminase
VRNSRGAEFAGAGNPGVAVHDGRGGDVIQDRSMSIDAPDPEVGFAPPAIGAREIDEVVATLQSGWLSTGPRVRQFEQAFAEYIGVPHAVAVNSGTAALHLSLLAAGIGAGDEVVTTPLTFCATANVIVHVGATPRFADIDAATWNLSPDTAADAMTPRTRALMPVHYAGRPVRVEPFQRLAHRTGAVLIEDAAHCVEGRSAGRKIGTTADLTCFSFYATKNLTTGEGGMLTTSRDDWAAFARVASLHGMSHGAWTRYANTGSPHYDVEMPGYKYNMMDLQAAIGLHQLASLEDHWQRRDAIWRRYDQALADLPVTLPAPVPDGDHHARHLYTMLVGPESGWTRDALAVALRNQGVATSVHFRAVHLLRYYADRFAFTPGMFPVAEMVSDRTLSLPLSAAMRDDQVERVVDVLRRTLLRER